MVAVENPWLEVVGKRVVVVGFGRMVVAGVVVVVGRVETVLYWGSWLDRYDEWLRRKVVAVEREYWWE